MKEVTSLQSPVVVCSDVVHVHRPRGCGYRTCDEERPRGGKTEESENCLGQPNPFPTFAFWPETQAQDIRDNAVIQLSWFFKRSHILRSIKRFSPKMRATISAVSFQTQLLAQAPSLKTVVSRKNWSSDPDLSQGWGFQQFFLMSL